MPDHVPDHTRDQPPPSLGQAIRAAREARGWSQGQLALEIARRAGPHDRPSQSTVASIESGRSRRPRFLAEIADALGMPQLLTHALDATPALAAALPAGLERAGGGPVATLLAAVAAADGWRLDRARPIGRIAWPHHSTRDLYAFRLPAAAAGLELGDLVVIDPHLPVRVGDLALALAEPRATEPRVQLMRVGAAPAGGWTAALYHRIAGCLLA